MCEIFFIKSVGRNKVKTEDLKEVLETAVKSADSNRDGWGIFSDKKLYRKPKKFCKEDIKGTLKRFKGSSYVVLHLRNATNGNAIRRNTHPFIYKHYVLCHNGIMWNMEHRKNSTDSEGLLRSIVDAEGKTTEEKIKETLDKKNGSYSVFLSDSENKLYYFRKTSNFNFCFVPEKKLLIGATNEERLKELWTEKELNFFRTQRFKKVIREAEESVIYEIGNKGITARDRINTPSYSYNYNYHSYDRVWYYNQKAREEEDAKTEEEKTDKWAEKDNKNYLRWV